MCHAMSFMQKEPCASNGSASLANFSGFEECEPRDDGAESDAERHEPSTKRARVNHDNKES